MAHLVPRNPNEVADPSDPQPGAMEEDKLERLFGDVDKSIRQQEQAKRSSNICSEILLEISALALVEMLDTAREVLLAAAALVVDDMCTRDVHDAPAVISSPAAPVELFGVHEELLVEAADSLDDLSPGQQTRADQPIDVLHCVIATVAHVVPRQDRAVWPPLLEPSALDHRSEQRRKSTPRPLGSAVRIPQQRADDADRWIRIQERKHRFEGSRRQLGIRVQEEDRPPVHYRESLVIRGRKPDVGPIRDQYCIGEITSHLLGRSIGGPIVDDHHLDAPLRS